MKVDAKELERLAMAGELGIVMSKPPSLWRRSYSLWLDTEEDSDYEGCVFYNSDLRSLCGNMDGDDVLCLSPRYYACKWGEPREFDPADFYGRAFSRLIRDAISVEVVE